ncbi:Hypothetical protein CINCED_3A002966 [Cinara cedri]|uniref:Uncharacterized protein n=1 Tax=Cinara cedri TaxID=506608 RepID=A0A5E4NQQ2_9HEMI|nr:Hypothetical protein CINCED_3A002966 [Cinara cedri]
MDVTVCAREKKLKIFDKWTATGVTAADFTAGATTPGPKDYGKIAETKRVIVKRIQPKSRKLNKQKEKANFLFKTCMIRDLTFVTSTFRCNCYRGPGLFSPGTTAEKKKLKGHANLKRQSNLSAVPNLKLFQGSISTPSVHLKYTVAEKPRWV